MTSILSKAAFILFMAAISPLYADSGPFLTEVGQYHLVFTMPDRFKEIPVTPNKDLKYDYAVKSESPSFEIRYLLMPDGHVGLATFVPVMGMDIAGTGNLESAKRFDPQDAETEFGADEALSATIDGMDSEFGRGYKNCVFLAIHRKDSGQAYIFFLFNDPKGTEDLLKATFHSLKFDETSASQ